jgi:hypothetical protein
MNDYEEAVTIADRIVAHIHPWEWSNDNAKRCYDGIISISVRVPAGLDP